MNTAHREALIRDAQQAGLSVSVDSIGIVTIRTTPRGPSIVLWLDGSATRGDVRLDLCLSIRSAATCRKILGLRK